MRRDRNRCVDCGRPADVAHHLLERRHGGTDEADNLVALCDDCHKKRHRKPKDLLRDSIFAFGRSAVGTRACTRVRAG